MRNDTYVYQLKDKLLDSSNVLFAYLFGSYSQNKETSLSDIDIAVYLDNSTLDERLQLTYELSRFLKKDVDLVVLNEIKNIYLMDSIFKDGIVLKDNDKRFDFEILKQHDILDFKEFRRVMDAA